MRLRERNITTDSKHEALYQGLVAVLKKHVDEITNEEMLAVCSNLVGKVLAWQDQRKPAEVYIEIVRRNIELGNQQVVAEAAGPREGEGRC